MVREVRDFFRLDTVESLKVMTEINSVSKKRRMKQISDSLPRLSRSRVRDAEFRFRYRTYEET